MLEKLSGSKRSRKHSKRVGRGFGSKGRQSGRGHKGQRSRSGGKVASWFEGGQTPLKLRSPKRGFHNMFKKTFDIINIQNLSGFNDEDTISLDDLKSRGLITGKRETKLLGNGELNVKLTVHVNAISKSAREKIERIGGKVKIV